jgi:hypothetical protein
MASQDYEIVLVMLTMSLMANFWLYRVNVKLDKEKRVLHALNARYQEYQEGWFNK